MAERASRMAANARSVATAFAEDDLDHPGEGEGWLQQARDLEELAQYLRELSIFLAREPRAQKATAG